MLISNVEQECIFYSSFTDQNTSDKFFTIILNKIYYKEWLFALFSERSS